MTEDLPAFHLNEDVDEMTLAESLKAARESDENKEWLADFRRRYDIPEQRQEDAAFAGEDLYEAHSHHEESHYGNSH